ncbi:hypothetical protein OG874_32270 [Nocardia sp. NBC_00565]|uniref:hypothetical protein n=1 Tax=Nocardia sp. NBC_00565 TaxID=2975993 RepID=UPI002E81BC81|nr:hypothetical protein [Nocardia sp. NBC_00565]WUC01444.1 hypothetical protein OG874_32270 [Nocardia sp. NBC_00565]
MNAAESLPHRIPFVGPPSTYVGVPAEVVERFAYAVREWAAATPSESSRCRGVEPSSIGRTNGEVA